TALAAAIRGSMRPPKKKPTAEKLRRWRVTIIRQRAHHLGTSHRHSYVATRGRDQDRSYSATRLSKGDFDELGCQSGRIGKPAARARLLRRRIDVQQPKLLSIGSVDTIGN